MQRKASLIKAATAALLTALAGMFGTVLAYQHMRLDRDEQINARFRNDAVQRVELVEDAFSGLADLLESAGRFMEESGMPEAASFERFVSPWIRTGRFASILWVVPAGDDRLEAVYAVPAGMTDGEASAILALPGVRDAVASAGRLRRLTASGIIELPASLEQPCTVMCRTVPGFPDASGNRGAGAVIGIVSLPAVLESAIQSTEPMGLPTEIKDAGSSPGSAAYSHRARIGEAVGAGHPLGRLVHSQTMTFADRQWTVEVRPSTRYAVPDDNGAAYAAVSGASASIMLTALVLWLVMSKSRAEAEVVEKSLDFENFFNTSLDLFAIAGTDGIFRRLNRQWIAALGYPLEQLEGARFIDFVHPDDRAATLEAVKRLGAGASIVNFVNRFVAKDGCYRNIEWRSTVGLERGTIFAAARDVTDRILMEESLRHTLQEKEALIKEVHHRVKNNMQVVSSLLDLEAMHVDEPRFIEAVRESQGRIRTMAMVHEQLYRRDSMSDIDLGSYLRDLVGRVAGEYADRAVQLSVEADVIPLDLDAAIPCGLAVNELVTNAFKYSHAGGERSALRIRAKREDGACSISVEDNGPGLPAGALERSLSGASLGLGLVSGLAAQLQGELRILPGPGARFYLRFPYPRAPVPPVSSPS